MRPHSGPTRGAMHGLVAALTIFMTTACEDDAAGSTGGGAPTRVDEGEGAGGSGGGGNAAEDPWEPVMTGWKLPAGTEEYRCVRITFPETVLVQAIEPIAPVGTHHVFVGLEEDPTAHPDGVSSCTAADLGARLIYGAGVGTGSLELPQGTALEIPAGSQLVLNLHLFNVAPAELRGSSGFRMRVADPSLEPTPLEVLLAGTVSFSIPAHTEATATGTCTSSRSGAVWGLMPHMHELGRHLRAVLRRVDGAEVVLHDAGFDVDGQAYTIFDPPLSIGDGDRVEVTCDWANTTDELVRFGGGSRDEMCFGLLLRDAGQRGGANYLCIE